jgi:hypothetical protein
MGAFETSIESTIARWRGIRPLTEGAGRLPADPAATISAARRALPDNVKGVP